MTIRTAILRNIYVRILLIGILPAIVAISWYALNKKPQTAGYQTAKVIRADIENSVTAVGILQPSLFVDVGAQVSGQIKTLRVKVGDTVKKGYLLTEIDPTIYSARVMEAEATLNNLKAQLRVKESQFMLASQQYARNQALIKDDAVAQKDVEITEASLKSAQAEIEAVKAQIKQAEAALETAKANMGYTKIIAPMPGTVVSIVAREGQTLNANQQAPIILRIADMDTMTVWAQVSEADVTKLRTGQEAYFSILGMPEKRWKGKLRQILPTPENVNNVIFYNALFDVPNSQRELKVQMTAQVFFVLEKAQDTLFIPLSALQFNAGKGKGQKKKAQESGSARQYTVGVLTIGGKVEERKITVGVMNAVSAEVLSGLVEDEDVITGSLAPQKKDKKGGGPGGNKGGKL